MAWARTTTRFQERVNALLDNAVFQERVSLVRAGLSWADASRMVGSERRAFIMVYNQQESDAAEDAKQRRDAASVRRRVGEQ